jgi:hypothetical protein
MRLHNRFVGRHRAWAQLRLNQNSVVEIDAVIRASPPILTAYRSSSRKPGVVFRVSRIFVRVPRVDRQLLCEPRDTAKPAQKFKAVRSPARIAEALPSRALPPRIN